MFEIKKIILLLIILLFSKTFGEGFTNFWKPIDVNTKIECIEECYGDDKCKGVNYVNNKKNKLCYHFLDNKNLKKRSFFTKSDNAICKKEKDKWILEDKKTKYCLERIGGKILKNKERSEKCLGGKTEKECLLEFEMIKKDQYWHEHPILLKQKYNDPKPIILGKKFSKIIG